MMYKHLVDPRRLEIRVSNPTGGLALPTTGGAQLSRLDEMKTKSPSSHAFAAARPYAAAGSTSSCAPRTTSDCLPLGVALCLCVVSKESGNARTKGQVLHDSEPKPAAL
jgi:hypothetical protein